MISSGLAGVLGVLVLMVATMNLSQAAALVAETELNYAEHGPCGTQSFQKTMPLPQELHATFTSTLALNITTPVCEIAPSAPAPPFPVLLFLNGFQARASYYHLLARRMGSWGYAVVQYDTPILRIFKDAAELQAFEPLMDWLSEQNNDGTSPLFGLLDFDQLVIGGHSRGGKLATLLFADNPFIRAAFLADPVDNTRFSPESPDHPSASKALAASGREVGIVGAGIVGSCNPEGSNYKEFWAAAANGSWLGVIPSASHSQFMDAGCVLNKGLDLMCGRGKLSRPQVNELTATPMLAYFHRQLQEPDAGSGKPWPQPLRAFFQWVRRQEEAGRLEFFIKDGELPPDTGGGFEVPSIQGEEAVEEC